MARPHWSAEDEIGNSLSIEEGKYHITMANAITAANKIMRSTPLNPE